jgi:probable O-glycosylation ligase (exosortase A-associated)
MRDLMFAGVWLALLPVSLMSAYTGVLLWVWVALLSPNDLLSGFLAGVPFNKFVAVFTCGLFLVGREKKEPYLDTTLVLLLLFVLSATVSWQLSIVPSDFGTALYLKLLKAVVLAFLITAVMTTRHRLHMLVLTIAISLGFLAVKEGSISLLFQGHKILGSGSVGDNNSLATALLMIIPLIYYLARYSAVRITRTVLLAVLGLSLVTVVMTFSRGGFIGLVVLALIAIMNGKNRLKSVGLVAAAAVATFLLAPAGWFSRLDTITAVDNDGSFMGRVVAWKMSWLIAMDHPFFGGGMHAVQTLAVWTKYRPLLPSLDFIATPPADVFPHAAHSIYFEVLGDTGFVGLALFLAALASALHNCRWIYRAARGQPELRWAADLSRMMQISLILYLVTGAALSMGYFELVYIMLALTSRCRRVVAVAVRKTAAAAGGEAEWMDGAFAEPADGYALAAAAPHYDRLGGS